MLYYHMARVCKAQDSNEKSLEYFNKALKIKLATMGNRNNVGKTLLVMGGHNR